MTRLLLALLLQAAVDGGSSDGSPRPPRVEELERLFTDGGVPRAIPRYSDPRNQIPRAWHEGDPWRWENEPFWSDGGPLPDLLDGGLDAVVTDEEPDGGEPDGGPAVERHPLRRVVVKVDHPRRGEVDKLTRYVGFELGDLIDKDVPHVVEQRLMEIGGFRAVACNVRRIGSPVTAVDLVCGISTARVIDSYDVIGLPVLLLRRELDKRIFLRPGERLDTVDARTADRVQRQRERIEEFLISRGYFGAKVTVETHPVPNDARATRVVIRIGPSTWARVKDVVVRGVPDAHKGEVVKAVKGTPWSYFKPSAVNERLDALERKYRIHRDRPEARISYRYEIDVAKHAAKVFVDVALGPLIRIVIKNATPVDTDLLHEQLTFATSGIVDEREMEESARAMTAYLQRQGYYAARVNWKREEGTLPKVIFTVRGDRVGFIRRVDIIGVTAVPEDVVRSQSRLASAPRGVVVMPAFPPLNETPIMWGNEGVYTEQDVADDVQRIERYLVSIGYTEAAVTSAVRAETDGDVTLLFQVEQGPRYVIKEVQFEGARFMSADELRRASGVFPGSPFIPEALDDWQARVIQAYARRGFLRTRVDALTAFDELGNPIVKFVVDEGERSQLAGIFIEGNRRTYSGVIRREMGLDVGKPMDPEEISSALADVRRTGVFRRVNARFLGMEAGRKDIFLLVQVEERPVRTVDGAIALSTSEYLSLGLEARDRNAFGIMMDVSARAQLGPLLGLSIAAPFAGIDIDPPQRMQNIFGAQIGLRSRSFLQLSLRLPHVFGTPFTLRGQFDADVRDRPIPAGATIPGAAIQPRKLQRPSLITDFLRDPSDFRVSRIFDPLRTIGEERRDYDQERQVNLVAQLGVEFPFWSYFRLLGTYGFELYARQVVPTPNARWDLGFPSRAGWAEAQFAYNRIDNPFDPRRGVLLNTRLKLGGRPLGAEGEFVLWNLQTSAHYTLWRFTASGGFRTTIGLVDGGSGNKRIVPRRDLGIAGGDRSVRGYDEDAIRVQQRSVRYAVAPDNPRSIVNEPGLYSGVVNLELRYALLKNIGIGDLQTAIFTDAGLVTDTLPPWSIDLRSRPTELGWSVGAGLRYVTPVGPISLDYGFDLLHLPNGRLHLLFGYTF